MIRRIAMPVFGIALSAALTSSAVDAATFDFIYADHILVTTTPSNIGFSKVSDGFGLLVNKGASNIDGPELFGATFTVLSSNPAVTLDAIVNDPGPAITPVVPDEALGSIGPDNGVLTTLLEPGETLHDTGELQVFAFLAKYPPGFSGTVVFDLTMTIGGEKATWSVVMDFTLGSQFSLGFPSAARTSSSPVPTPTRASTWGEVKQLYR